MDEGTSWSERKALPEPHRTLSVDRKRRSMEIRGNTLKIGIQSVRGPPESKKFRVAQNVCL